MDKVYAPAAAYHVMAEILPDWYFATQPPVSGVRMTITGTDGVPTQWDMVSGLSDQVAAELDKRRIRYTRRPYSDAYRK